MFTSLVSQTKAVEGPSCVRRDFVGPRHTPRHVPDLSPGVYVQRTLKDYTGINLYPPDVYSDSILYLQCGTPPVLFCPSHSPHSTGGRVLRTKGSSTSPVLPGRGTRRPPSRPRT